MKSSVTFGKHSIPRRNQTGPCPLSFAQERLWFLNQLDPGSPAYNQPKAFRLLGALNVSALKQALDTIIARHEALRTTFVSLDGAPVQMIGPAQSIELPILDLSRTAEAERQAEIDRAIVEITNRTFNLSQDLMLRAFLFYVGENDHVLLLVTYHIASDGWSMAVMFQELETLYNDFSAGRPSSLSELPIQFADYAIWQRQWLQGEVLERHLSYWRQKLTEVSPLALPTKGPRGPIQTFSGARESLLLSPKLSAALRVMSGREKSTLFMILLAAFKTLLHRYTGQNNIAVGSPIAGRTRIETEGLIGFLVDTLVLCTDLSRNPKFSELLKAVRKACLGAYAHPDVPFEKLMAELQMERSLSQHTLFQVMFNLQIYPSRAMKLTGLTVYPVDVPKHTSKFDLTLFVGKEKDGLRASFIYNTDLFDETTIKRMLNHLENLIVGIVANPDYRISQLPLLSNAERHQLLKEWNNFKQDYPVEKCIHPLIEAQVERTPDNIAVIFEDQQLSYRQLNDQSNWLALSLQERNIGKGSYVPILMDRSIEVVISMLAIMKVGAAFVPLDTNWPTDRIKQALEDLNSEVILVNKLTPYRVAEFGRTFLTIDGQAPSETLPNLNINIDAKYPIYAIYTSGSTGRPKAAVVPHRGISNRFFWMNDFFGCEAAASVLQTTPHMYDSAVWQLFWPLINGGKTVIPSPGMEIVADHLSNLIERHSVTMTDFVPSVFNTIVPRLINDEAARQKLRSLRSVVVGGEEITPATTYRFMEYFPQVRVVNLYGPTEASIGCICYEVTGKEGGKIPIGTPISNVQALILDKDMNPVPVGVSGELYLSGLCLGLGYLNEDEKTKHAFINIPLPEFPNAKMYKTGDLARYLPDGNIDFLGRVDNQVKIRGFRIELGEIETALTQHPAVEQAIVLAREQLTGEKRLFAYIVPSQEQTPSIQEVRSFLKQKLPAYMVPSAFVFLDALPLTPNGKIDRRALPTAEENNLDLGESCVAARTPEEEQMVRVWTEILKVNRVGIYDNFFDLGGHSLLATQVVSRVGREFNVDLPLRTLFEAPTVAGMAAAVLQSRCESIEQQKLCHLLSELESLTDDDAQRLLADEIKGMNEET
jgi:amino acid adenylation domain-containing protein